MKKILLTAFFFYELLLYAEVPWQDISHFSNLVQDDFGELDPRRGYDLYFSYTLQSWRHQGSPSKVNAGSDTIGSDLLIRELFPSPDGVNLSPQSLPSNPWSHIKPSELGKIIKILHDIKEKFRKNIINQSQLKSEIKTQLTRSLNPNLFHNKIKKKIDLLKKRESHSLEDKNSGFKSATSRNSQKDLENHYKIIDSLLDYDLEFSWKGNYLSKISDIFEKTLLEEGISSENGTIFEILWAFAWAHYHESVQIFEILAELTEVLTESGLSLIKDLELLKVKINTNSEESFSEEQLLSEITNLNRSCKDFITKAKQHPEKISLLKKYELNKKIGLQGLISYSLVSVKKESMNINFSDCAETSVLNFINLLFFSEGSLNIKDLLFSKMSLSASERPIDQSMFEFLVNREFKFGSYENIQESKNLWAEKVVSFRSGIDYNQPILMPQVELKSSIINICKLLKILLKLKSDIDLRFPSAILDEICSKFSSNNHLIEWSVVFDKEDNDPHFCKVFFYKNHKIWFAWTFLPKHTFIKPFSTESSHYCPPIGEISGLLDKILIEKESLFYKTNINSLMYWFLSTENLLELFQDETFWNENPLFFKKLIYSMDLSNIDTQVRVVKLIILYSAKPLYGLACNMFETILRDSNFNTNLHMILMESLSIHIHRANSQDLFKKYWDKMKNMWIHKFESLDALTELKRRNMNYTLSLWL